MPDHTSRSWFAVPAPVAALFRRFPLAVYPANDLPLRSPSRGDLPTLYVFVADDDAPRGRPSFNPSCLKWQKPVDECETVSLGLHSPTGSEKTFDLNAINGLDEHTTTEAQLLSNVVRVNSCARSFAWATIKPKALLDTRLRTAWLYALYLAPDNATLLSRLYVRPASRNPLVRLALAHQVRSAAEAEVLKSTRAAAVDPGGSTPTRNGGSGGSGGGREGRWFFGCQEPTLFDASVFAYTHLLLDGDLGWADRTLSDILAGFPGLVRHRERLLERCFPNDDDEGVLV
ncbi:uncharacterized protein GLRG_04335 [Colletotrichum graminicola M1.001]|uniref:Metaxin glutathione S-transferase domain-containing protein n=1 Tax=Colletotrichum graminicola (strain M1.001 / M2 / FGSC 10212) TaxID=645133 RepID=E3QEA3_COLGM|nr:uncharacterized protein GLRG_04335 [Colletotrichum graminicola M1.001]EFQ29191.1 hypothetical protein GLRG_04335 [Colletotrichum graminicola M1.001]